MYKNKKAFTIAEALIVLTIIGVISALMIGIVNSQKARKHQMLQVYNNSFQRLSDATSMAGQLSKNYTTWSADDGTLQNLYCSSGSLSACLKTALMSVTSQVKDCDKTKECKNIATAANTHMSGADAETIILPNGAHVAMAYTDKTCSNVVKFDASGKRSVHACGFFMVDVNGNKGPNSLIDVGGKVADRYIIAIQPTKLVEDNDKLTAFSACGSGMVYDHELKACVASNNDCPTEEIPGYSNTENVTYQYNGQTCIETRCKIPGVRVEDCCLPISTLDDLKSINNSTGTYCLTADIDASGETGVYLVQKFSGRLFGNNKKIEGFALTTTKDGNQKGVFQRLEGATIKDLKIVGSIGNGYIAGGLAAQVGGGAKITNVDASEVNIDKPTDYIGGLIGYAEGGGTIVITNSKGSSSATDLVGHRLINVTLYIVGDKQ